MPVKPVIAITMGDPAGIGPEIGIKAMVDPGIQKICRPVFIGTASILQEAMRRTKLFRKIQVVNNLGEARWVPRDIVLVPLSKRYSLSPFSGLPSPDGGGASIEAVQIGARLTRENLCQALVTGPVNKAAVSSAGIPFSGHTEYLAELFAVKDVGMLLVVPSEPGLHQGLRVLLATTHVPLKDLPRLITFERITKSIYLGFSTASQKLGIKSPRIGVAGLNPHGGEKGLFGSEEETIIRPAVEKARADGVPVTGPWPADTLFHRAVNGEFDLVIALYHDQALIPVKLLGFHRSVNVTIGLPIIRTSVDHGTAYDIAGKGCANPGSLIEAIRLAVRLARIS